jgi:hypothetical protein
MKFGYACTFAGKPRGGTPAPPFKKRTPVLPRLPACRALSGQIGKCIFRTGRRQQLAFGGHVLGPGLPHLAVQQKRHNRRLSYPPPSHKACLENIYWAAPIARSAPPCLRAPDWAVSPHRSCFCLLGASDIGSDISKGGIRPSAGDYVQGRRLASGLPEPANRRIAASQDHFVQSDDRYHHGHDGRHGHAAAKASSRHSSPPALS